MTDNYVDITGRSGAIALALLLPYMAHPEDQDRRERLQAWYWARVAVEGKVDFPGSMLRRLTEAAEIGVGSDFHDVTPGGCMAGDVLYALLGMADGNLPDAGLDKAFHVVSVRYKGSVDGRGNTFKAGRDTVMGNWKKYRTVAHLWAAYRVMSRGAEGNGVRADPSKWLDGRELAAIARALQDKAKQFALPRNGAPILPDTALNIKGVDLVPAPLPPLSAPVFEALKTFQSRFRE